MSYIILDRKENFIIIGGGSEFQKGVLFLYNILYKGKCISLPFAKNFMEKLSSKVSLLDKCTVLYKFGENKEFAMLTLDCESFFSNELNLNYCLKENCKYTGTVLAYMDNTAIISVRGHYGYLEEMSFLPIGSKIDVAIVGSGENKMDICQLVKVKEVDEEILHGDKIPIEEFLTKEELLVTSEEDLHLIKSLLESSNGITRKNINVIQEYLYLSYRKSTQSDLHNFLTHSPHYFEDNNFWVGCYVDAEVEKTKLIIFDSNNVVLEVIVNELGMWVTEFSHDKNKRNAQYLMEKNQRALIISGNHIHIHEDIYVKEDYVDIGNRINIQFQVAKFMLAKIQGNVKKQKEKAGVDYLILRELLSYQEQKEREQQSSCSVEIPAGVAKITANMNYGDSSCLALKKTVPLDTLFVGSNAEVCYVELHRGDEIIKAELKEDVYDEQYVISFYRTNLSLVELCKSGFEIQRRANLRHLQLQEEAIDDFVYGNDNFYIFRRLKQGELIPPETECDVTFFNPVFNSVEEGNNQSLAIRKAIGTQDIFLIQGPPGTGKTSVIIEIIMQLVLRKNEKVLVCCQAHSAVRNIYERLRDYDNRIKIGNIDVEETMQSNDIKEHPDFLKNNMLLLSNLWENKNAAKKSFRDIIEDLNLKYKSSESDLYLQNHEYVFDYMEVNKPDDTIEYLNILSELRNGLQELGNEAATFNNIRHYQSLDVVMGTCIGVGMDRGLKQSGMVFDTVIIDEAGKANLAETAVPMQLGKKYILVGDQRQLPPYVDKDEISSFIKETSIQGLTQESVMSAISYSLFEDFLEDDRFPSESTIQLNYQYRMNPEIASYVSDLFYDKTLKNGHGTEKQTCPLDEFSDAVTFIDTSVYNRVGEKNIAYEEKDSSEGYYNPYEIEIFRNRILPNLIRLKKSNEVISVGIITPYRSQRQYLLKELLHTPLEGSAYTIDSIQGTEFDIVVISLVRAFSSQSKKTVGFLDDMRRLNVAFSRAKKKMIIIGNLETLCTESNHVDWKSTIGIKPAEVFKKLREIKEHSVEKTSLAILKDAIARGIVYPGYIFEGCVPVFTDEKSLAVKLNIEGKGHTFPIKYDEIFRKYGSEKDSINVKFIGIGENGRALFEYIPNVSIAEQIKDGMLKNFTASSFEWENREEGTVQLYFEDGSSIVRQVSKRIRTYDFIYTLISCRDVDNVEFFAYPDGTININNKPYFVFEESHSVGELVELSIIDYNAEERCYIVRCGCVYGKIYDKGKIKLQKGRKVNGSIFRIYKNCIIFNSLDK